MAEYIVVVTLASHLKRFGVADVLQSIPPELRGLHRVPIELDTLPFHNDSDGGDWAGEDRYLRAQAGVIQTACGIPGFVGCYVFCLAEVPSLLALGAYCADRVKLTFVDWDRFAGAWRWPTEERGLELSIDPLPQDVVRSADPVVVRLEISATITDEQVLPMVGENRSADVRIRPRTVQPRLGLVRSEADVIAVRDAVRRVIAAIGATRPLMEELDVFVAAPCSGTVAFGQELQLRNLPAVQTYRFRPGREGTAYSEGIRLREWPDEQPIPITDEDHALANRLRAEVWRPALEHVGALARSMANENQAVRDWRVTLSHIPALLGLPHLPALPPLHEHVDAERDSLSDEQPASEYTYDKERRLWRLRDDTVLGLWRAADAQVDRAQRAARLFLFHEYLHDYHRLRKLTAAEAGAFPNVLERIDYIADLFAILHELEFGCWQGLVASNAEAQALLADSIELVLHSIRAFAGRHPLDRVQERALRRRLNWHWRLTQVRRARSLEHALDVLSRQPAIEISGLVHSAGARRVYVCLDRFDERTDLAVGLVSEDGKFAKVPEQAAVDLSRLVNGFRTGDHEAIKAVMSAVFEQVGPGALPY